jgi:membrane protease YdiL (CAAX protease family)
MSIISIGIIPAFTEEMLFRGIILNGFKNNYSEKKAILVSALLFGFWHLNPWQFGSAFILGLLTAFICLRTGSILLCIYIHLFNNVLAVIVVRIMTINGLSSVYSKEIFQLVWLDIIGMIITIFGIIWLAKGIKNFNKTKNENDYFI